MYIVVRVVSHSFNQKVTHSLTHSQRNWKLARAIETLSLITIYNTPGTRVGPGFHDRTLTVKSRRQRANKISAS